MIQTLLKIIICSRHWLHPFWDILGPSLAMLGLCWSNADAILTHLRPTPSACDRALGSPSWVLSGSIWGPILGPDRPKRGQDGPKRTIKRCKIPKTRICKNLENIWFLKAFGGPRPSKTGSEDPRRLPRSYLRLLRAILSHLWGMLGPGASKIAPAALDRAPGPRYWILLGSNLGTEIS